MVPHHKIPDSPATSAPSGYDARAESCRAAGPARLGHEPLLPAPKRFLRFPLPALDHVRSQPVGSQGHDATAPDVLLRSVAIANHRLKTAATIGRGNGNGDPGAHALGLFRQEETASRL